MTLGHNSGEAITADRLRSFVERVERVNAEIADLNADKAEIFKEAKDEGFDTKAIGRALAARAKNPAALSMVVAGYDRGDCLRTIASDAGITARHARDLLYTAGRVDFWRGLPPTHKKRLDRRDKNAAIVCAYHAGVPVKDIARQQSTSLQRVYEAAVAAGLRFRYRRTGRKDRPTLRLKKVRAVDQGRRGHAL